MRLRLAIPALLLAILVTMPARAQPPSRSAAPSSEPSFPGVSTPLEDPSGKALASFHASLARTKAGKGQTRVVQYGASHTAADLFSGQLRRDLQARFGDAGPGFVLPARAYKGYRQSAVRIEDSGRGTWLTARAGGKEDPGDGRYGVSGVALYSSSTDSEGHLFTASDGPNGRSWSEISLYYLVQPGGGDLEVIIDGKSRTVLKTTGTSYTTGYADWSLRDGPHDVWVHPLGNGEVRIFGLALERRAPGVIWDTMGINGARADVQLRWDPALAADQLARRNPDLVVLAYGTNEVGDSDPIATYERRLKDVLARLRGAAPRASCVLMGPTDRPIMEGRTPRPRPRTDELIAAQKRAVFAAGCAYWDARAAMGGAGAMERWVSWEPRMAQKDHVHLTKGGYYHLAGLFLDALMTGFDPPKPQTATR